MKPKVDPGLFRGLKIGLPLGIFCWWVIYEIYKAF